jgi:alpha-ketoglutarate-dependent taurine dioxygenase
MPSAQSITVTRIQPFIGAEIRGVDLTRPLDAETTDALRQALLDHQVIVLRDQDVSREQHRDFAAIFSRKTADVFTYQVNQAHPVPGFPEILSVFADGIKKTAADVWHTDESFRPVPPGVSVLRSRILPSIGGDTVFSSAVQAYAGLPDEIKDKIRSLKALHGPVYAYMRRGSATSFADPEKVKKQHEDNPPYAHPVVRIHPETGRPVLYVNEGYTGPILGLEEKEAEELGRYLFDQFKKPDYQMRVKWSPNTIVVWDNRSVQHYAVADYNEPRRLERITVAGEAIPVGFDDVEARSEAALVA